ncbi:MAG: HAMP domain-containing histidine kinase [Lachnospiraceae bacterium]|nr:HAMP domain-containing histidine kinase [Lachnospiraceae bacterium]
MKKLFALTTVLALLLVGIAAFFFFQSRSMEDRTEQYAVQLNEIANEISLGNSDTAKEKTESLRKEIREKEEKQGNYAILLMGGICIVFLFGVSMYFYVSVIRPFRKLTDFAERVGGGDLDIPLEYERSNYFGKFTWAFDNMREEIKKARACEKEAIENNKTVIASLSHDIKTPVSTIRAYAEALEMGMDADPEKHQKYVETILKKCDEVKNFTEEMLTHSLTELQHLKMSPETFEISAFTEEIVKDLKAEYNDIECHLSDAELFVYADKNRIAQVVENLVSNSRKYAKTKIDVTVSKESGSAVILVRDFGPGIPDEELPFVFGKFYRGKTTSSESGAGLGLFIVKYIVEQSGGKVSLRNVGKSGASGDNDASEEHGLEVRVELPLKEIENGPIS